MKEHISITIDRDTLQAVRRKAAEQRRSLSNVVEIALSRLVAESADGGVVTTTARYDGAHCRDDSYGER
jgi:hypothetical protein